MRERAIAGGRLELQASALVALPFFVWAARSRMEAPVTLATLIGQPLLGVWGWAALLCGGLALALLGHAAGHAAARRLLGLPRRPLRVALFGGCGDEGLPGAAGPGRAAVAALAGPAVSAAGAIGCVLLARALRQPDASAALTLLGQAQAALAAIHLIPAPPLDGALVLRAALGRRLGRAGAARAVLTVGRLMAVLAAAAGALLASAAPVVLAGLLWAGAEQAARGGGDDRLEAVTVGALAVPAAVVEGSERAALLAMRMRVEERTFYLVADGATLVGLVAAADVAALPPGDRRLVTARALARRADGVEASASAGRARALLGTTGLPALPVLDGGRVVGVVTRAAIEEAGQLLALAPAPTGPQGEFRE